MSKKEQVGSYLMPTTNKATTIKVTRLIFHAGTFIGSRQLMNVRSPSRLHDSYFNGDCLYKFRPKRSTFYCKRAASGIFTGLTREVVRYDQDLKQWP